MASESMADIDSGVESFDVTPVEPQASIATETSSLTDKTVSKMADKADISDDDMVITPEILEAEQSPVDVASILSDNKVSKISDNTKTDDDVVVVANTKTDDDVVVVANTKSDDDVVIVANTRPDDVIVANTNTDEDLDIEDETIVERLVGLTEMFPESVRSATSSACSGSIKLLSVGYSGLCKVTWFASTVSLLLFAPVLFEVERINTEEMLKQDRNKLVLGPGSAMSGPPPMTSMFSSGSE